MSFAIPADKHFEFRAQSQEIVDGEGFVNPRKLSDEQKKEMLAKIASNEILSIRLRARVYADVPNKNKSRIDPEHLEAYAAQYEDLAVIEPVQLEINHGYSTFSRIGTCERAEIQTVDGVRWVVVEATITDRDSMERYVRGNLDRFSIGLGAIEKVRCSDCGKQWVRGDYGWRPGCGHKMGVDGVEAFITAAPEEVSFVLHPAVAKTAVLSRGNEMGQRVDNNEIEAALLAANVKIAELETELAASAKLSAELASARERLAQLEAANRDAAIETAVKEGRILPAAAEAYRKIWDTLGEVETRALFAAMPTGGSAPAPAPVPAPAPQQTKLEAYRAEAERLYRAHIISRIPSDDEIKRLLGI